MNSVLKGEEKKTGEKKELMMNFKTARKRRKNDNKNDSGKEVLEREGERNEGKRERGREGGNTEGVEGGSYVCY